MSYQICKITLKDGRIFNKAVIIQSSIISEIDGSKAIQFTVDDIENIDLTHEK